jgi:hypothetical protein
MACVAGMQAARPDSILSDSNMGVSPDAEEVRACMGVYVWRSECLSIVRLSLLHHRAMLLTT